jgi:glycosyltransferase involved in cell wall biosynthesis
MVYGIINDTNKATPEIRVAFVCYSPNASFIRNDYRILSKNFIINKFNYRRARDALGMMAIIWRSDVSFSWFAGGHAFLAVLFSKILRKKAIVVAGGFDVAYVPEINYGQFTLGWHKRMLTKFALNHADLVLPVSKFTEGEVLRWVKPHKMRMIYNGVHTEKFKRIGNDGIEDPKSENLVITVGRIDRSTLKRKGFEAFIKSARLVPEASFVVIGNNVDDTIDYLKAIASPNVKFTGFVSDEDLLRWYQRAKVYVQASAYESFGISVAEAMLCECVPVVAERGALPEVVGDTGFYVPYSDAEATAEAIKKALKSEKGAGARDRIIKMFSLERRENELKEIIQNVWYDPSEDTA